MELSVQIGKGVLRNPVGVASGTFGYGPEYAELVDLEALGAIVVKGICVEPTPGNPTRERFNLHDPNSCKWKERLNLLEKI